ncbi:DUF1499 domain-containing protein [Vibrio ulleungensis]|jgi:uncharacterized protein (DUF1499 family)|nr:DUF1499 domain-containing protein [Vibrio ulleungensis]
MRTWIVGLFSLGIVACSNGVTEMEDRTANPCGDKPNCVSTQDQREKFNLAPFKLKPDVTLDQVELIALGLKNAKTAEKSEQYLRIECTSSVFRFVDDLELSLNGDMLTVRSESRTGHSDFGVNRKRAEALREGLTKAGLLE